ncbi:MAG: hypothetical protein KJ709_05650 [Nanoarchaeota archaeon]|nr:hypothetical protein [Nanoarchaeota archaeon]
MENQSMKQSRIVIMLYVMAIAVIMISAMAEDVLAGMDSVQTLEIDEGWNFVSFNVLPADSSVEGVFGSNLGKINVIRTMEAGTELRWDSDDHTLTELRFDHSYYIHADEGFMLRLVGQSAMPLAVELHHVDDSYTNYIGNPYKRQMPLEKAFNSILDKVLIIKDSKGKFYIPDLIDQIGSLQPGMGYEIAVSEDLKFTYPPWTPNTPAIDYPVIEVDHDNIDTMEPRFNVTQLLPDLIVEDITVEPETPFELGPTRITYTVKNIGETIARPTYYSRVRIYNVNGTEFSYLYMHDMALRPGQSLEIVALDADNESMRHGAYTIEAGVDIWNHVRESNEYNNNVSEPLTISDNESIVWKHETFYMGVGECRRLMKFTGATYADNVIKLKEMGLGEVYEVGYDDEGYATLFLDGSDFTFRYIEGTDYMELVDVLPECENPPAPIVTDIYGYTNHDSGVIDFSASTYRPGSGTVLIVKYEVNAPGYNNSNLTHQVIGYAYEEPWIVSWDTHNWSGEAYVRANAYAQGIGWGDYRTEGPFTVNNSKPDLTITDIWVENRTGVPPSYMYYVRVKNIGNAPSGSARLRTWLNPAQPEHHGDDTYECFSGVLGGVPSLEPGEEYDYNGYFNPVIFQRVDITAYVDYLSDVDELDEDNNQRYEEFNLLPVVNQSECPNACLDGTCFGHDTDVMAYDIEWSPENPIAGDVFTYSTKTRNVGEYTQEDFYNRVYINNTLLATYWIESLAPGQIHTYTNQTGIFYPGTYEIKLMVDYYDHIDEDNEENNELAEHIIVVEEDEVTDVMAFNINWSPYYPVPGENVTFAFTVKNTGETFIDHFGTSVMFTHNSSGHGVGFGMVFDTYDLAPGESYTKEMSTFFDETGNYSVTMHADNTDQLIEVDENNNWRIGNITVLDGNTRCNDSDGIDYYTYGIVTYTTVNGTFHNYDRCSPYNPRWVIEQVCDGHQPSSVGHMCEDTCFEGRCIDSLSCYDSDGDLDYNTTGVVYGIFEQDGHPAVYEIHDECSQNWVHEMYCDGITPRMEGNHYCQDGCVNGACI